MPRAKKDGGRVSLPKNVRAIRKQLSFSKRKEGLYPPSVRNILETNGSDLVKTIKITRTPVNKLITGALDVLSAGKFSAAVKKTGYDSMFHLAIIINGEYTLEKNAVVNLMRKTSTDGAHTQTQDVAVTRPLTLQQLLDNTKAYMGDSKFSNYSAFKNNCQDFILAVLAGSGLSTAAATDFVKQDAAKLLSLIPSNKVMEGVANAATELGAILDKELVQGESVAAKETWRSYYGSKVKGKKFSSKKEVNEFMRACASEYKAQKG